MSSLVDFFAILSISQMLMAMLLLAPYWRKTQSLRLYIALMVCGILHVSAILLSVQILPSWLSQLLYIGNNALPGVFWLVSLSVFGEHVSIKRWHYGIASLTLFIPISVQLSQALFTFDISDYDAFYGLTKYGAMALELTLLVHALVVVSKYWDSDLVQSRRYIRGGVIGVAALYIFLVIIIEQLLKLTWTGLDVLEVLLLAMLMTVVNLFLFRLGDNSIFDQAIKKSPEGVKLSPNSKELTLIINAMEVDKAYQQDGLTISLFAKQLGLHEYKLRGLINGELSFRNFNDFLNHYRIAQVTSQLGNVGDKPLPVLTLALESGFRSLSSFNKAFKDKHGVTPTEYRKKASGK